MSMTNYQNKIILMEWTILAVFVLSLLWAIGSYAATPGPQRFKNASKQFAGAAIAFSVLAIILYVAVTQTTDPIATAVDIGFFVFIGAALLFSASK